MMKNKLKIGIYGLTGCAGDQLVLLNCEDELLTICKALDIKSFWMAMSENDDNCLLDIALVEGSVVQPKDEEILRSVRDRAKLLIAIGTCAVWGGMPAMKNEISREKLKEEVYGPEGKIINCYKALPLRSFVKVDFSISGCPVEKDQLIQGIASLLHGDLPLLTSYAVCAECKMAEYPCQLIEKGSLCLGAVTVAGCKARCPAYGVPCRGCRGPVEEANVASEINILKEKGFTWIDIQNTLRAFASSAESLKTEPIKAVKDA